MLIPRAPRVPTARYFEDSTVVGRQEDRQYEVEEIIENCVCEGKNQYEVWWVGINETSWMDGDSLNCIYLIDEYELNNNNW